MVTKCAIMESHRLINYILASLENMQVNDISMDIIIFYSQ